MRQTVSLSWQYNGRVGESPTRDAEVDFSAKVHPKYCKCCVKLDLNRMKLYINFLLSASTKHQNTAAQQAELASHHLRTAA